MIPPKQRTRLARTPAGYDFTAAMRALCHDLVAKVSGLAHIDVRRVAIAYSQTRKRVLHGLQATLTPLRFEAGQLERRTRGRIYRRERLFAADGTELLYILRFYLPRFFDLPPEERILTVVHELWHIHPEANGDLRRFPGRCFVHSRAEEAYNRTCRELIARWRAAGDTSAFAELLHASYPQLRARHGAIWGTRVRTPRIWVRAIQR